MAERRPARHAAHSLAAVATVAALLTGCVTQPPDADRGGSPTPSPAATTSPATSSPAASGSAAPSSPASPRSTAAPTLARTVVARGLDHPWDLAFLPGGDALITERAGRIVRLSGGRVTTVLEVTDTVARAEAGLMGLAVDPDVARTGYVFACLASSRGTRGGDVRVARWRLADGRLTDRRDVVTGIPLNPSGFHNGCRLAASRAAGTTTLWVSTGDAYRGTGPQDRRDLAGKILRVDADGRAAAGNPAGPDRRVFSWGHRNPQGLALFDEPRRISGRTVYGWSVEHGPDTDDEVNPLVAGNFGWAPDASGGYDQSVPMTDTRRFADAIPAAWSSGSPTVAPSGGTLLRGDAWAGWAGALAVAQLKGSRLMILSPGPDGRLVPAGTALDGTDGRLRQAVQGPDGALWVTTDDGGDDRVVRLAPTA